MPTANLDPDRLVVPDGHANTARTAFERSRDPSKLCPACALALMIVLSIMLWAAIAGLAALLLP